jgi:tetratricopeptide (TPR) repeat protein
MKPYYTTVLLLASISTLSAQTVPPALMVQQDGRSLPLGLAKLQTEVRIVGAVAETTTTMTFANPMPRAMEGDLYFPLPEGATISGYALDIDGAMVDGVAVEKHEARRVFEEVVRRGIDPGLVQWTKGNNFQTRVFPIPAHGSRTVRVSYVTELLGGKEAPAYHLPLKFKDKVHEFSLRVEVVKPAAPPAVAKGELANFAFEKWRDSYVAETKQQDWSPVEDLVIALPEVDGPQVVVEKADDGQTYFAVQDYPAVPAAVFPVSSATRVVIFWDTSGSRAGDHKREMVVLQRYLERLLPAMDKDATMRVDLVLVRNAATNPLRLEFSSSNPSTLVAALEKVQYDGGTQLGAIGPLSGSEKPDLYLLFTDGISNFGREEPAKLDAPLVIFSADAGANHALLHSLAMTNGGQYFNLANWKDADVVAQAGREAWSFLSAAIEGGRAMDLYPQRPQPLTGRFTLVGRLTGEAATVTVNYGFHGGEPNKRTFKVSRSDAAQGSLLRGLWAQKKLAELMIHQKRNEKEIAALGKQFGLVTPYTSLLVLDSPEQYVQYEIAPPKSLAAMREEYMRRIDTVEHQKQKQKADKLAEVVRMWEGRVKWWNAEFKYAKDFKYRGEQEGQGAVMTWRNGGAAAGEVREFNRIAGATARPLPRVPVADAASAPAAASPAAPAPRAPDGSHRAEALIEETLAFDDRRQSRDEGKNGKQQSGQSAERQPGIVIKPWEPDAAYLKELRAAKGKDLFAVYMKNRARYGTSPGFFLDCADFFRETGDAELALQVLSNIAELELEDAALLRVLGYRLLQIGQLDLAVQTFEQVLALRPEEPQSYRDLALALARRAEDGSHPPEPFRMGEKVTLFDDRQTFVADTTLAEAVRADYARAIDLLAQVVMGRWDARFPEIEVIALEEVNHIIPRAKAAGVSVVPLDPRLIKLLDVDVRIVMTWSADNTDIDLWVTEPSGEKAFYSHNRTTIGGLVSRDFTQGYGPEEYLVRRAAHGMYKIDANYFGSRATRLLGPVTVQVDVLTNYGRPNEQRKSLTLRLKEARETVRIGEIEY